MADDDRPTSTDDRASSEQDRTALRDRVPARGEVEILELRVYGGPNYWAHGKAIRMLIDLHGLEDWPTDELDGFNDRLLEFLPELHEHTCSTGERGGFVERLKRGTWLGHVGEHVALELQNRCGHEVSRGKTRGTDTPGQYNVIFAFRDEVVGRKAGEIAIRVVNHLVEQQRDFNFDDEVDGLIRLAQRAALGPSTRALVDEAESRDIPWMRLDEHSLIQLGQGIHQKRIRATMTSQTSALGVDIASDKELTARLLDAAGLPVPGTEAYRRPTQALRYAEHLGWPVVVKPLDGNHGRGVGLNLSNEQDFLGAFDVAQRESKGDWVVVERFIRGNDYRFLIVDGVMAAVAERTPAHVIGDGEHTVEELVAIANADPRRGIGHEKVLTKIMVDDAAVALVGDQGHGMSDVPPQGERVLLVQTANLSTGGISIDRTDDVHPDNVDIAEQAAKLVGLDIAGIDFIAPDISKPVRETGGAICEVNAAPGFRMHTHPTIGEPQFVGKRVIDMLFPPGTPSRIPIVAVTGTNGKTTTTRMISHIFRGMGRKVGLTTTNGVVIDERLVIKADASGPRSAKMVLQNPGVDQAVFEVARGGLLREGLGYERNDVAVVTNVASDHLGRNGIETLEDLAYVKQIIVEAVPRDGTAVLNADDEYVVEMRHECDGEVILFTLHPDNEIADRHRRRGRRIITLDARDLGDMIVVREGDRTMDLAFTHQLPSTFGGAAMMNVQNAMAAAGAALASGAHLHDIRQGLKSFTTSYDFAPGRMNLEEIDGITTVVDYCHNAHGMERVGDFVTRLRARADDDRRGERICVVATAGDRRDVDCHELGFEAAKHFERLIIREDDDRRGRGPGEVATEIANGIRAAMDEGIAVTREVEIVLDELEATGRALDVARRHDIVVFCAENVDGVHDLVARFRADRTGRR